MRRERGPRINHQIRSKVVRLIGPEGRQIGVVDIQTALAAAKEAGLDLVEVAPNADPVVCRIMDFGKYKYEQKKKAHEAKKKHHTAQLKEIRLRAKTDSHDLQHKIKQAQEFLESGNKVLISLRFRGREIVHQELGLSILHQVRGRLQDLATVEREPKLEGRRLVMLLSPNRKGTKDAKDKNAQGTEEKD